MAAEILTREDLAIFKTELFRELRELVNAPAIQPRKWLKSYEVREMLGISPGTLQNMRINGTLSFTKIGGLIFYEYDDILKLMEGTKKTVKHSL
ncbi:helix-turn-helix protein [Chitinophaga niastensis]|uniref:Helix-turn-helix protein n=1 Tax=Chitinophaga niastensis TaxID=536980 RepID=A0A2P8H2T9_CHINA|nr:helix-turn-helix domain-containing protein [Chitinophaga niastensis]PSL40539.1 helix-turn-helix protein [Chitinophaga niastensis]